MKKEKTNEQPIKYKFRKLIFFVNISNISKYILANNALAKARAFFRSFDSKPSNENHRQELLTISPITNISISKTPRVDKINPHDMIVHRVLNTDDRLPTNYFREKYKQYLKPTLLYPRQYYQDLLSQQQQQQRSYSWRPTTNHRDRYSYRPIEKEFQSISTWNQCVRRLNTEYRLTLDALEQAKQCLKRVSFHEQHLPPRSNDVVFIRPSTLYSPSSPPMIKFAKPRIIKPVELQTFTCESDVTIDENVESIGDIIKKFNELNRPRSPTTRVHFKPSITTISCSTDVQDEDDEEEEETTYSVETLYTQDFLPIIKPHPKKFISHIPKPINSSRTKPTPSLKSTNLHLIPKSLNSLFRSIEFHFKNSYGNWKITCPLLLLLFFIQFQ